MIKYMGYVVLGSIGFHEIGLLLEQSFIIYRKWLTKYGSL